MSMRSSMRIGLRKRAGIRTAALVGAAAGLALAGPAVAFAAPSTPVSVTSHFVFVPTTAEVSTDSAYINNGATDDRPGDLVFVQENATPGGVCGCSDLEEAIGVWYASGLKEWAVFDENQSLMTTGNWYNILVMPKASKSAFVHRATTKDTSGDHTLISSKLTNDNPKAIIQVTQVWNPGGSGTGVYNADTVGVEYYKSKKEWGIFNEDKTRMPVGAAFNVLVGQAASNGGSASVLVTTKKNIDGSFVLINNPKINGDPNNITFVTPDYNPGGKGGTFNDAGVFNDISVWYLGPREAVFDDTSPPPVRAAFNLLIFSS
jgi:hypothetical protein